MSTLSSPSKSPLNSATIDTVAITAKSAAPPPLQNALVTTEGLQFFAKCIIDVTGASLGLLFLSPLLWIIILLIRLDSKSTYSSSAKRGVAIEGLHSKC